MTQKLSSYAAGSWYAAADDGTPILDSSTGEVVATVSSTGLDVAAMVEHARTVGGPALRALTFQQRGLMLKELGKYLTGRAGEIHANYGAAGATTPDAQVDVNALRKQFQDHPMPGLKEVKVIGAGGAVIDIYP